jgi:hypothetical protein
MIRVGLKLLVRLDERAPIGRHADLVAEVFSDVLDEAPEIRLVVADQQSVVLHHPPHAPISWPAHRMVVDMARNHSRLFIC